MNTKLTARFILLLSALLMVSCAYKPQRVLFQSAETAPKDTANTMVNVYHIQPQDILQVRNLQNINYVVSATGKDGQTMSAATESTYQVEEDGRVALPVIGRVAVGGLTRAQAAAKIEDLYKKQLLKDPIIDLRIMNMKVTVFGEVKTQGNYPLLKDNTTLTDVLGEAGGLTENANEKMVKIIRGNKKDPQVIYADMAQISSLADPRLILQNNDIIYVIQNNRAARKEALQNASSWLQPALLLLNTALVIYTLTR